MTALSDALAVAQARAVAAISKSYVAGTLEEADALERLSGCGVTDPVDTAYLLACLDVARELGTGTTTVNGTPKPDEAATDKQIDYIRRKLCDDKAVVAPEGPLTKAQASTVIESLQAGTYDADTWQLPF